MSSGTAVTVYGLITCTALTAIFTIGTPALIIAQAIKNRSVNKQIARDLSQKTVEDELYIPAHSISTTLIFVKKKNYSDDFTITLTGDSDKEEEKEKELGFEVTL